MHPHTVLLGLAAAVALAACSSVSPTPTTPRTPTFPTGSSLTSTAPSNNTQSSPAPAAGRSVASWRRLVDSAVLTRSDLTSNFTPISPKEGGNQTECPSLHAAADSRSRDIAYRRVSFEMSADGPFLDEVIAVNPDATKILAQFATSNRACSHFTSTDANGNVIAYTVTAQTAGKLGDRAAAVWVDGTTTNANGTVHVGSGVVVFQKGAVLVQVSTAGVPPPPRNLATVVAKLAARKLASVH